MPILPPCHHPSSKALVVGAGAVENSWDPVIRALNKHSTTPIDKDNANLYLTRIVHLMRFFDRGSKVDSEVTPKREYEESFRRIKDSICEELLSAEQSGELQCRSGMRQVLHDILKVDEGGFIFVTANWDRVAERGAEQILNEESPAVVKGFHIHGSIAANEDLYLPSEESFESYRSELENELFGGMHSGMMQSFGNVEHLILYGLSLSPLDAELAQILSVGVGGGVLKKATVVAPDHVQITSRLRMLVKNSAVEFQGVDPRDFGLS